jgi:hypothetical protein
MSIKFWQIPANRRANKKITQDLLYVQIATLTSKAITDGLTKATINHKVTHAPRPPAPRPMQMTVTYIMVDGMEYRTFIPLNGQAEWVEQMPHYVQMNAERVSQIRYSMRYNDGGML